MEETKVKQTRLVFGDPRALVGNVEAQVAVVRQSQQPEFDGKLIIGQARGSHELVLVVDDLELNCVQFEWHFHYVGDIRHIAQFEVSRY